MAHSKQARTTYPIRIRRLGAAGVLVVIVAIAAALGYHLLLSSWSTAASRSGRAPTEHRSRGVSVRGAVWPGYGQAAVQIGQSRIQAGPKQHAAPIASLAKVMTAYLVLHGH
ncbi:MAG TPA: hypothetical protein VIZ44_04080, partial [Gaiellaceae bacterium]